MTHLKFIFSTLFALSLLSGCSSSDKQKVTENIAEHRATVLSAGLPYEIGALSIMRATARRDVIEIMMIYNTDDSRATISPTNLIQNSINTYCASSEVITNLEQGINYKIILRNARGQLLSEQLITTADCKK